MKKLSILFFMDFCLLPVLSFSQVIITADSNHIKLERTGNTTVVMFTKDIKFGYITNTFYFADKLSSGGWDYTIKYSDITSYNTVAKTAEGYPSFSTMRDALIEFIKKGKASGGSSGGDASAANQVTQLTRMVDSSQVVALQASIDSTKRFTRAMMGLQGSLFMSGAVNKTATPNGWCIKVLEAAVVDSIKRNGSWITSWTGAAGQTMEGKIDSVANTSGKIIIYYW